MFAGACAERGTKGQFEVAANNHNGGANNVVRLVEPSPRLDRDRLPKASGRSSGLREVALPPGVALADGRVLLSEDWHLELGSPFWRRREEGSLVLWRPALTLWVDVTDHEASSASEILDEQLASLSSRVTDLRRSRRGRAVECSFRQRSPSAPCPALRALIAGPQSYVDVHAYFDRETELATVRDIISSIDCAEPFGLSPFGSL